MRAVDSVNTLTLRTRKLLKAVSLVPTTCRLVTLSSMHVGGSADFGLAALGAGARAFGDAERRDDVPGLRARCRQERHHRRQADGGLVLVEAQQQPAAR